MKLAARMEKLPPYLFLELDRIIEQQKAEGHDVINLGIGDPDQPTPPHIVNALKEAAARPANHRYPNYSGSASFRRVMAEWYQKRFQVALDPLTQVVGLIGSKEGIAHLTWAMAGPGDVVLVPEPSYPVYYTQAILAGADVYPLPLLPQNSFLPDLSAIPDDVAKRAKLMWINYPNNPTGRTAPASLYDAVIDRALSEGTVLAHDLAYGDITYDGVDSVSLLSRPGGIEAGIEFTTLSKSYNMAGWRIGFAAGNAEIIRFLELLQDHLNCSQWGAVQEAAIAALHGPDDSVQAMRALYQKRRDTFLEEARRSGWLIPPSQGSIFVWCPVPRNFTALQWTQRFLEEAGVVVAPGTGFGAQGEGYVRIALTESEDRLVEAARRLASVAAERLDLKS